MIQLALAVGIMAAIGIVAYIIVLLNTEFLPGKNKINQTPKL